MRIQRSEGLGSRLALPYVYCNYDLRTFMTFPYFGVLALKWSDLFSYQVESSKKDDKKEDKKEKEDKAEKKEDSKHKHHRSHKKSKKRKRSRSRSVSAKSDLYVH